MVRLSNAGRAEVLTQALPYIQKYNGKVIEIEGENPVSLQAISPMEAVRDVAGLKTEGGAVIFSVPVDDLVGIGRFEDYVDGEEETE